MSIVFKHAGIIHHEIRYTCANAGEVYIIWGINNWQLPQSDNLPPGSFIKDKLQYSKMSGADGSFSIALPAEPGYIIDYVFWITKTGSEEGTDIWDTNVKPLKDYHTLASENTISLVESKLSIRPAKALSILDYAYLLLFISVILTGLFILNRKLWHRHLLNRHPLVVIGSAAITLLILLFLLRSSVPGISTEGRPDLISQSSMAVWAGYYDALFVLVLTIIFFVPVWILKNFPATRIFLTSLYIIIAMVALIAAVLNIRVVEMLGKPFNYQWLYYSDFLKSADSKAALSSNVSADYVLRIIALISFSVFLTASIFYVVNIILLDKKRRKFVAITCFALGAVYFTMAQKKIWA